MSVDAESELNRKAALDGLRFRKTDSATTSSPGPSSAPSTPPITAHYPQPPPQSRDPTLTSRFWLFPPESASRILVPNSSPLGPDNNYHNHQQQYLQHAPNAANYGSHPYNAQPYGRWPQQHLYNQQPAPYFRDDVLTASSGFSLGQPHRPANNRPISQVDGAEDSLQPRKRINRGPPAPSSPNDPLNIIDLPSSPEVQRPGQRRRLVSNGLSLHSSTDDESIPDTRAITDKPRIVRGQRPGSPAASTSGTTAEDPRFIKFKVTMPTYSPGLVRAAWMESQGDVIKATELLSDLNWRPMLSPAHASSSTIADKESMETGKVQGIEEANRARRAEAKEKAKKSSIYANRPVLDVKAPKPSTPTPPVKPAIDLTESPASPLLPTAGRRRLRRVVDSESEAELEDSGPESRSPLPARSQNNHRSRALEFFNTAGIEALQELTGCTDVQAQKLIDLRPYTSSDEINTKLGQTKKKAGPWGISPRIFEDTVDILEGYGEVDSILEECESIGAKLRSAIAAWTISGSDKQSGATLADDIQEDGALSLRSKVTFSSKDKNRYLSQPSLLHPQVKLKEYQLLGVNWLHLLYNKGFSCILADEMGLGKTVQVISFFALLKERGIKGPHLVVVPSSTLENWCREFARFAPSISVQTYYAGKEERPLLRQTLLDTQSSRVNDGWEVLITTYALAQGDDRDRKFFKKVDWETCVFDEGHMLKNFESERYRSLLKYQARWRLLLTGTPLQNNLQELVSLMNFILPEQFAGNMETLRTIFKAKGDSKITLLAQERVSRAKKMMTPFVLRRRKDQVLLDLPQKTERIEWCEMTSLQRTLYDDALRRSRKTVFDIERNSTVAGDSTPSTSGSHDTKPAKKKSKINPRKDKMYLENSTNVLMDLRKAASHPMLFRSHFTDDTVKSIARALVKEPDFKSRGAVYDYVREDLEVMTDAELQVYMATYKSTQKYLLGEDCYLQAGKVKTLLRLMETYMADKRRMLIFSQFTQVLDILRAVLGHQKIKYLILTGATAVDVRQSLVDEFNEDETITVFLLSTKAGGMGINLTAASVVVMFDQDFNPHNDRQAQDRAYRIGQKRDVEVVKLITRGTVEEDMLRLGETKLALDEAVAGDGEEGGSKKGMGRVEKEMTRSLMHTLRQKFENEREETKKTETTAEPNAGVVDDLGSPLTDVDMDP